VGNDSFAKQHVAGMALAQLQNAITHTQAGFNVLDHVTGGNFRNQLTPSVSQLGT
jgi:hypothetical protein